jgi:hypothetical protein
VIVDAQIDNFGVDELEAVTRYLQVIRSGARSVVSRTRKVPKLLTPEPRLRGLAHADPWRVRHRRRAAPMSRSALSPALL